MYAQLDKADGVRPTGRTPNDCSTANSGNPQEEQAVDEMISNLLFVAAAAAACCSLQGRNKNSKSSGAGEDRYSQGSSRCARASQLDRGGDGCEREISKCDVTPAAEEKRATDIVGLEFLRAARRRGPPTRTGFSSINRAQSALRCTNHPNQHQPHARGHTDRHAHAHSPEFSRGPLNEIIRLLAQLNT